LPDAHLEIIKGAGHAPFISHVNEFLHVTTAFINEPE